MNVKACQRIERELVGTPSFMCQTVPRSLRSSSLQPHGLKPARLLCLWDFPGKNSGVGSHVHGIFQARVLECGAIAFSGVSNKHIEKCSASLIIREMQIKTAVLHPPQDGTSKKTENSKR